MIYKKNNQLILSDTKVKYFQNNIEIEQHIGEEGLEWWNEFEEKWDNVNIISFVDAEYTNEELERFDKIKDLNIADNVANEYVFENIIGKGLGLLKLEKENEELKQLLADITEQVLLSN